MYLRTLIQLTRRPLLNAHHLTVPRRARQLPVLCLSFQQHRRLLSTPPPQESFSHLSADRYHALSDATMDALLEQLEVLLDGLGNPHYEVEYHSGVLTLSLAEKGTYVINKQPPNKQIWLSSPFSGPKRYDYEAEVDDWLYSRDGRAMGDLLNEELSKSLGEKVDLRLRNTSSKAGLPEVVMLRKKHSESLMCGYSSTDGFWQTDKCGLGIDVTRDVMICM